MATILVVDDDQGVRFVLERLLQRDAHQVVTAANGQEALAQIARIHPDLILMDMSMPVLNGWETTRRLKQQPQFAAIPVIALTASDDRDDHERALHAGCAVLVPKPSDIHVLRAVIAAQLVSEQARPPVPA